MRTVRDLRRLMKPRAVEGPEGEAAMDAVVARLIELNYLSDTRFAAGDNAYLAGPYEDLLSVLKRERTRPATPSAPSSV